MSNPSRERPDRRRFWFLLAGALLATAVVAAAVTFMLVRRERDQRAPGGTSPVLVGASTSGSTVKEVSAVSVEGPAVGGSIPFVTLSEGVWE